MRAALQRAIWRSRPCGIARTARRLHAQALAHEPEDIPSLSSMALEDPSPSSFPLYHPPPPPSRPPPNRDYGGKETVPSIAKIQRALKARLTADITNHLPELEEGELREFYTALIESGRPSTSSSPASRQLEAPAKEQHLGEGERRMVLHQLAQRILPDPAELGAPAAEAESSSAALRRLESDRRIEEVLGALNAVALNSQQAEGVGGVDVPLGLVSRKEWDALFDDAIALRDPRRAEAVVTLRQAHGQLADDSYLHPLITTYAERGMLEDVYRLELLLEEAGQHLSPSQHDLIVTQLLRLPSSAHSAIAHLRKYESALPAPQSSYNLVLSHLLTASPTSHTRALAWDLFAHMRLKAHPTPNRAAYTTMIAGCETTADPRPEQARDLWIEMTVDGGIIPEEPEYTAIIRALCSTKRDYLEAFDLFRQMLAKHHEAVYAPFDKRAESFDSRWVPSLATWKALLEGTKRAGDQGRARWVLAECVKLVSASRAVGSKVEGPDEEMMGSVFMSYATWKPTVRRGQIKEREEIPDRDGAPSAKEFDEVQDNSEDAGLEITTSSLSTSPSAPTTSADAIREANALFAQLRSPAQDADGVQTPWTNVKLTPRLLNSFLSVHFAHSPSLEAIRDIWTSTWSTSGLQPNGWSYMLALERCAQSNRSSAGSTDRATALSWGKELWGSYLAFADAPASASPDGYISYRLGVGARQVERTWRAAIRLHALGEDIPPALDLLDDFHRRFPPSDILQGYAPTADAGLEMRFSDPTTILEPDVPPHLLFPDVDVLHQRLVRDEQWRQVGHVKWVVTGYEKALERRRKWRLRGVGKAREARKARAAMLAMEQEHQQQQQLLGEADGA